MTQTADIDAALKLADASFNADLTEAQFQTDNWRKVAEARAIENGRLRRIIMASDDGVTPE